MNIYKLDRYKITEFTVGEFMWESHFGFAAVQEGRCFRKGSILFIGPAENERHGSFNREFFEHLKPFPKWLRTEYFCKGLEVYHCRSGKRVTTEEMKLWMLDRDLEAGDRPYLEKLGQRPESPPTAKTTGEVTFRLKRYEITTKANGQILWETHPGPNTVSRGTCILLDDILFIGTRQTEQSCLNKRQFLMNLRQLPKWDQTRYYCPKVSLYDCETGAGVLQTGQRSISKGRTTEIPDERNEHKDDAEFKLELDLSKDRTVLVSKWIRRRISHAADFVLLMSLAFFDYSVRQWKKRKRKWNLKKIARCSMHRSDE